MYRHRLPEGGGLAALVNAGGAGALCGGGGGAGAALEMGRRARRNDQRTPMGRGREDSTIDGLVLLGAARHWPSGQQRERIHVERVGAI